MSVVLVPPHADFTLEWPEPEGFETVDAARFFARTVLDPARLRREADALGRDGAGAEGARALLQLRAAAELLGAGGDALRHLRAGGAALSGLSTGASPMRLRLDDVELPGGTTQRSRDLPEDFEALDVLFGRGLSHSLERCAAADGVVRLRLDRDQQLPALVALVRRLEGRGQLQVTGAFAARHWEALARLPGFSEVRLHRDAEPAPRVVGSPLFPHAEPGLRWVDDPYRLDIPRERPWGGVVPFEALAEPQALVASGCRGVVVGFCELGVEAVGADGSLLGADALAAAVETLRAAGIRVIGEWWIGAPGIGAEALDRTLQLLESASPFDGLAGVRPFHWLAHRGDATWGRAQVRAGDKPEDRDLARYRFFEAPGTLPSAAAAEKLQELARRLARTWPLVPGRLAQAYASPPTPLPERGSRICLDPDCAVVASPLSVDGKLGTHTYAVNLRTGLLLAVDPRLAPSLQGLRAPGAPGEVLTAVPEAQRSKLVKALVDKAVLIEVR